LAVETLDELLTENARGAASGDSSARTTERRRYVRIRIAAQRPTTVRIDEKNAALVVNIGEGGMRVQALGHPVQPGATLWLEFHLPGSPAPIRTSGVVAWANDSAEAGIRFAKLSQSLARRLRAGMATNRTLNAGREFMQVAGGWPAALDLMADLTRMLTGARGVAITLAAPEQRFYSSLEEGLQIRSTVAAPIYESERVVGHLEIFSSELGAFDEQDLSTLPVLAAVVGEMITLRAAAQQESARKAARLSTRIVSRIEGLLPTIRVRLVREAGILPFPESQDEIRRLVDLRI